MALARWQGTIVDEEGNILSGASVEVRREDVGNSLATLFADRNAATPTGNPITADTEGFAFFHVVGGSYRITATKAGFTKEWRYVGIGLGAETDGRTVGIPLRFDPDTADADPGTGQVRFNNAAPASVTTLYIDNTTALGDSITALLDSYDDLGSATNRGVVYLQNADSSLIFAGRVTGNVVDGTGYRKVTVVPLITSSLFLTDQEIFLSFTANGTAGVNAGVGFTFDNSTSMADPGTGDLRLNNATLASVTAAAVDDLSSITGNPDVSALVLSWDDHNNGNNRGILTIKDVAAPQNFAAYRIAGASTDNAGWTQLSLSHVASAGSFTNGNQLSVEFAPSGASDVGKQTIWVPATAMYKALAAAGPSLAQFTGGSTCLAHLAFDPALLEDAFFSVAMPKSWDEGQVSAQVYWFHPATATNFTVNWQIFAQAYSDGNAIDGAAYAGTGTSMNDTGGTTNTLYISPESSLLTIGNSPAEGDWVHFIMRRNGADGSDTLAVDALLIGVKIHYTTNASTDA